MTRVDINRGSATRLPCWKKTKQNKKKKPREYNLNVLPALPSLTSWQPSRERKDEVVRQEFLWQHHAKDIHPTTENMLKAFTHARAHTPTHANNEKTCSCSGNKSHCYRVNVHIASRETEKNFLHVCQLHFFFVFSSADRSLWHFGNKEVIHEKTISCSSPKMMWEHTQEEIMALGMRR